MKYPYLTYIIDPILDESIYSKIEQYWEMKGGKFTYKPTLLSKEIGITRPKLTNLVQKNSKATLYVDECVECKNIISLVVDSQSKAKKTIEDLCSQCENCKSKLEKEIENSETDNPKQYRLEYAIQYQYWNKLTKEEFSVLKQIVQYNNYNSFRKKIMQSNINFYWPIIEKLDRYALIDIQREHKYESKIKNIYFLPELAKAIKVEPSENIFIESSLNFNLPERKNRTKETQPNYFKKIKFDKDINITAGTEYFCSVWKNSDGSINFGIKPKSEIISQNDGTKDFEPKSIGEIIAKLWE